MTDEEAQRVVERALLARHTYWTFIGEPDRAEEEAGETSTVGWMQVVRVLEAPVEAPAQPTSEDARRRAALRDAEAYVAETVALVPPTNSRGYPIDGWTRPDPAARLALVLRTAGYLLHEEW